MIPSEVSDGTDTYTVVRIGDYAFNYNWNVLSVNIPNTVTYIGIGAFAQCSKLSTIDIPNSVTTIGSNAFQQCSKLASIKLSSNLQELSPSLFAFCESLTTVEIPESVTSIAGYTFDSCKSLNSVRFNSVTPPSLGDRIFAYCPSNITIEVPASALDAYSSSDWGSLGNLNAYFNVGDEFVDLGFKYTVTSVDPKTVKIAKAESKEGTLVIPGAVFIEGDTYAVTEIADYGFERQNITSLTIHNFVSVIGNNAFAECKNLESVDLGPSMTALHDNAFRGCDRLASINLPETLTSIGKYYCPVKLFDRVQR